ncbi:RusA family crossover junction endodeoxyribonuclease [Pseudaeromonas paramecii]|uniref:Crossover junction endodeoxyribonuclease rusA n=1 Tax=Pseudaeromonas paramecii TaxID=2138166 RepID=A0ABP8PYJ3_9GAMM
MMQFELPWPPSTNRIWRNVVTRGRPQTLLSTEGRKFRTLAGHYCQLAGVAGKQLTGRLAVELHVQAPDRRGRDLDNVLKATLDALTHAGVWGDDSQIDRLVVTRGEITKGGKLLVSIEGAGA